MTLIMICVGWIAGILLGFVNCLDVPVAILLAFFSCLLAVALHLRGHRFLLPLCFGVLMLGSVRYAGAAEGLAMLQVRAYNDGSPVTARGTIVAEPDVRASWTAIKVEELEILEGQQWIPVSGAALARVSWWGDWRIGDRLELSGKFESPPTLGNFWYRDYLARQGIVSILDFPDVKVVASDRGGGLEVALASVRACLSNALAAAMPEPQAGFAQGILLGMRGNISPDVLEAFNRTGMTHILAISGFNIALVASALSIVCGRLLRRGLAMVVVIIGIGAYTLMVGAGASVVRAAIMGSIVVFGAYFGRQSHLMSALLLAASLMTLHNPFVLSDVGFQLSFLATAGLGLVAPPISGFLSRWPAWIRNSLALTVAAQLTTTPVIAVNFQQLSVVALPANLLVLPAVPVTMLLSALTALGGAITPLLGEIIGWIDWLFVTYIVSIVEMLSELPWAAVASGSMPVALAWVYYLGLGLLLANRPLSGLLARPSWGSLDLRRARVGGLVALAVIALVAWSGALASSGERLCVAFLDVGQGDAILISTPHRRVLIDGGPHSSAVLDALGRRLPFWERRLDLVIATHPDEDHIGGLIEVVRRYQVGQVMQSRYAGETGLYGRWLGVLGERGVPMVTAVAGQEIDLGDGVELSVLHPRSDGNRRTVDTVDTNEDSLVLRLTCQELSFLLTGDAGPEAQRALIEAGAQLESTVLKVPHHGAAGSLSPEFLSVVKPQVAVVSVGLDNRFGHPDPSVLRQLDGTRVLRTDLAGTVEIIVDDSRYWLRTGRW